MELFEQVGLPGGNVALCRSSWESIRKRVVRDSHIVEIPGFKRVVVASNVLDYCRKNPLSVEKGKSGDSGVKPRREVRALLPPSRSPTTDVPYGFVIDISHSLIHLCSRSYHRG
jgi:hypothetical protein